MGTFCDRFWPGTTGLKQGCTNFATNFHIGRPDAWPGAPDFLMSLEDAGNNNADNILEHGTPKLMVRSIIVADKGDAPEIGLRCAGPDNTKYNEVPAAATAPGKNCGQIYWQSYGGTAWDTKKLAWWSGNGNNGRVASIYARTVGDQTATSRAGELWFNTTPKGNPGNPVSRMNITSEGALRYNFPGKGWKRIEIGSNGVLVAK